jgi:hypothetical protein
VNLTTLAKVKTLLELMETDWDGLINELIGAVSERCASYCNRDFENKSRVEYHDGGGPLSGIWVPTFIAKGIIFGFSGRTKGTQSKTPIPLFVLKRSVVVPRRIHPKEHLLDWAKPKFMADLSQIVKVG